MNLLRVAKNSLSLHKKQTKAANNKWRLGVTLLSALKVGKNA